MLIEGTSNLHIFLLILYFKFLQGFTCIAPSVLEDIYKTQIIKARPPRKTGIPFWHHFGFNIGSLHGSGSSSYLYLEPCSSSSQQNPQQQQQNQQHLGSNVLFNSHSSNYIDEMMKITSDITHI